MDRRETDPNELLALIFACAAEKYQACSLGKTDPQTLMLEKLLREHCKDTKLDRDLFEKTVKQVLLQPDASVWLRLQNGVVTGGEPPCCKNSDRNPGARRFTGFPKTKQKLRVAAYCRVSTEEEEQQNSFEVQVNYYTDKITHHDNWQLAGIFADDGISGVSTRKREQFNEMMELCRKKKIDLILTKSISRFARNTLDCIKYVRILKSWGIPVIFEKENINTANMTSEMILTFLSSFAQAESESISQNVARGKRMGYKQGKFAFPLCQFFRLSKGR